MAMASSVVFFGKSWLWAIPLFCSAAATFRMAWIVFGHYEDKLRVMERLKAKLAKGYDQRYFLPYMGTACYRHVVYFTLTDSGLADRYPEIRRHYRKWGIIRDKPKTTKFKIVGGRIVFEDTNRESLEKEDD